MNLYLISQSVNEDYDTYDSAVVCAETEEDARSIHPEAYRKDWDGVGDYSWCDKEDVTVKLIGTSINNKSGVVCASFNAG